MLGSWGNSGVLALNSTTTLEHPQDIHNLQQRALAEIKMLDKRINKSIHECELVKIKNRGDKWDVEQFNKEAKSSYASIMDLIKRRDYLKFKIIQSNAHTTVNIGSNEYTIAQAIDLKNSIQYKKDLLQVHNSNIFLIQ